MIPILLVSLAVALALAALIVAPLLIARRGAADRAAHDAAVYRDQLAEVERDRARGLLSDAAAEATRAEIGRRLIAAERRAGGARALRPAPRALSGLAAGLGLIGVPALAGLVYLAEGSPGLPDRPLAARMAAGAAQTPSQAEAEARVTPPDLPDTAEIRDYAALIERLEGIVAARPEDVEGRRMLAEGYVRLARYAKAWPVYAEIARLSGPRAEPALFARQTEAMVLAAGGLVTPEASAVLDRALALDPAQPTARFLNGLRLAQAGRIEAALAVWEPLSADAPADAEWRPWLGEMLAEARRATGRTAPPREATGPDAAAMAAADAMSAEEREAMVAQMVARLEARLTERGGAPEEWVRLIRAYEVLGRREDARRIYALSQQKLAGGEAGFVREQALALGVIAE